MRSSRCCSQQCELSVRFNLTEINQIVQTLCLRTEQLFLTETQRPVIKKSGKSPKQKANSSNSVYCLWKGSLTHNIIRIFSCFLCSAAGPAAGSQRCLRADAHFAIRPDYHPVGYNGQPFQPATIHRRTTIHRANIYSVTIHRLPSTKQPPDSLERCTIRFVQTQ